MPQWNGHESFKKKKKWNKRHKPVKLSTSSWACYQLVIEPNDNVSFKLGWIGWEPNTSTRSNENGSIELRLTSRLSSKREQLLGGGTLWPKLMVSWWYPPSFTWSKEQSATVKHSADTTSTTVQFAISLPHWKMSQHQLNSPIIHAPGGEGVDKQTLGGFRMPWFGFSWNTSTCPLRGGKQRCVRLTRAHGEAQGSVTFGSRSGTEWLPIGATHLTAAQGVPRVRPKSVRLFTRVYCAPSPNRCGAVSRLQHLRRRWISPT